MVNSRVSYILSEPWVGGDSLFRVPYVISEPVARGTPNVRVPYIISEPWVRGTPKFRVPYIILESYLPIPPEEYMSTEPFPGFGNSVSDPTIPQGADPFNSSLPGLSFSVHKKPTFNTRINEAASGFEVRNAMMAFPRWDFELSYEFLEDRTGSESSLKTILGFFLARQGASDSWLFKDPDDYLCVNSTCGTTDGVNTVFYFCREMVGGFLERVGQVDMANPINLYLDDVLIDPGDYEISMPNRITFDTAPAAGTLTADFQFFFVCRFVEDQMDFEKFMDKLWSLQQCDFRSLIQ